MLQFDEHIFQMGWFNHQLEPVLEVDWIVKREIWGCPYKVGPEPIVINRVMGPL